ncbi:hypothetical protein P167DRAFT_538153 [Morchella conica CCBAS932]|uniref:Uncharacterized protein n=1 Tax=Morchella conica CCBAS932 TaxID=1392247 RepID=A0A3N4KH03_9PEZI|nr:hypothetical protein P167DRAFT_538153 [Morchella conica CCBAS932]
MYVGTSTLSRTRTYRENHATMQPCNYATLHHDRVNKNNNSNNSNNNDPSINSYGKLPN